MVLELWMEFVGVSRFGSGYATVIIVDFDPLDCAMILNSLAPLLFARRPAEAAAHGQFAKLGNAEYFLNAVAAD